MAYIRIVSTPPKPASYPPQVSPVSFGDLICGKEYFVGRSVPIGSSQPILARFISVTNKSIHTGSQVVIVQVANLSKDEKNSMSSLSRGIISDCNLDRRDLDPDEYFAYVDVLYDINYQQKQAELDEEYAKKVAEWEAHLDGVRQRAKAVEEKFAEYNLSVRADDPHNIDNLYGDLFRDEERDEPIFHLTISQMEALLRIVASGQAPLFDEDF